MSILKDSYTSFMKDIEANIKNKEDLNYIKSRFAEFLDIVLQQIDYLMDYRKGEVEELEKKQKQLDDKMDQMENIVRNIEKDIYLDDGFDFEIVCPYCNYEFVIDVDENKTEIECPECNNIIELDWTGDLSGEQKCTGSCLSCNGCSEDLDEEDNLEQFDEDDDM